MLLLATEIWRSHGGIQRYMRMMVRILTDYDQRLETITLLDRVADLPNEVDQHRVAGCAKSKIKFFMEAIARSRTGRGGLTIVGHIGLMPVAWLLKRLGFIKQSILMIYGIESWRKLPWTTSLAIRSSDAVVSISAYTASEFCRLNDFPLDRCRIIPLACTFRGIDGQKAAPQKTMRILVIARLARADAYKGIDTLIDAIQLARRQGREVSADIVGDGDDRPRLEERAHALGVADFVTFHGYASDQTLEQLLVNCHCFAMPSKKEGFGIVYVEAMSCGLPCIGANHGGTPEVIEHGESGFLVEYGDAAAIVWYLSALMDNPFLYRSMSEAAKRRAAELSLESLTNGWKNLLKEFGADSDNNKPASLGAAI